MDTISRSFLTFLLNALWQVPLVTAVAALACRMMRSGPASHRHAVWIAALIAAVLLPMASLRPASESSALRATVPSAEAALASAARPPLAANLPGGAGTASKSLTISYAPTVGTVLLGAYLLFLLSSVGRLLWAWMRTERIREEAHPRSMPPLVEKVWLRCLEAFGLYDIELRSSATIAGPVAAGAWRKTIILPETLVEETSEDMLTTAIGHEMAHLARRDFAWKVVYETAFLPISFHPAALVIRRGIEQTREMACDELVTRNLLDAGVYARSIVAIAASMTALPRPGYTLGVFDGDILEQRIRRLVAGPVRNLKRARLLLATGLGAVALCAAIASGLAISARAQAGPAQDEMRQGGAAYNSGDFQGAVQHFQNAVKLEPTNIRPKLFLANALLSGSVPGEAETAKFAEARQQYLDVLAIQPQNHHALDALASLATLTRQFGEAHDWLLKAIAADPKDAAAYYTVGFVDWSMAYPIYAQARAAAGMRPEASGIIPDAAVRKSLRDQFGPQLEEGFRMLQIALELKPGDSDAMAYMNLLYRIQSGIVDSDTESKDAVAKADGWVDRALAARRQQAQNPRPAEKPLDVEADAPSPHAPPPPPPPPPPPGMAELSKQPASAAPLAHVNLHEVPGTYWQVVGNGVSAGALNQSLQGKGFVTRMIFAADHLARVMVGPYNDPQSLEQARAALTAAGVQVVRQW